MQIPDDANTGIRRCPNCGGRENGKTVLCLQCFWRDGVYSRYTGECELRRWAAELEAAGATQPTKVLALAERIKHEREKINSLISDWQAGAIVIPQMEEVDGNQHQHGPDGRRSESAIPPNTQCGC